MRKNETKLDPEHWRVTVPPMTGMATLVFETSTPHASICTIRGDGALDEREFTSDRSHNAVLFSPLKELLDACRPQSIERVIVGSGPGSYSGTRVGIAAAQGVAIASGCPAVAVPSILGVSSAMDGAKCLAIGDARRGSYWTARVDSDDPSKEPELTDAEGLQKSIERAIADGAVVFSFEDPARFPLPADLIEQILVEIPTSRRLWHAWETATTETRKTWSMSIPQPIYLKPPHITPPKRAWLLQP
jgi:tRNA threonylcarbamoyladenosine biosynthesis protein TsaB